MDVKHHVYLLESDVTGGTEDARAGVCGPVSIIRAVDSVSGQTKVTQDIALAPRSHAFYRKDLSRRTPWLEMGTPRVLLEV